MCVHVVGGVRVRVGARARCVYAVSGAPGYQATGGGGGAILRQTAISNMYRTVSRYVRASSVRRTGAACARARVPARVRACPVLLITHGYIY